MKGVVNCVLGMCFLLGVFVGFVYLMTLVDPGLLELREKAAAMMREDRGEPALPEVTSTLLPSEDYIDGETVLRRMLPDRPIYY